jgi:hypothetical protein
LAITLLSMVAAGSARLVQTAMISGAPAGGQATAMSLPGA